MLLTIARMKRCVALLVGVELLLAGPQAEAAPPANRAASSQPDAAVRLPARPIGRIGFLNDSPEWNIDTLDGPPTVLDLHLRSARGELVVPPGKRVCLLLNAGNPLAVAALGRLKPDDLYMLHFGYIAAGRKGPGTECLGLVTRLTGLRVLDLTPAQMRGEPLKQLQKLKSLERFFLPNGMDDVGLSHVCRMSGLKTLCFANNDVSLAGFDAIKALVGLEELSLQGENLTDAALRRLSNLHSLRFLQLAGERFTDNGLAYLAGVPSLRSLDLRWQSFTDEGLMHIARCDRLENLNLFNNKMTDAGLVHLIPLKHLKKLDLDCMGAKTHITDAGMVSLKQIKTLERLDLPSGDSISDAGVKELVELPHLKSLRVGGSTESPISDSGLEVACRIATLELLSIGGKKITDDGVKHLLELKALRKLHLSGCRLLTNSGMTTLGRLTLLEELNLSCTGVGTRGLGAVRQLVHLRSLEVLNLQRDETKLDLTGLNELENLMLETSRVAPPVTDEDLASIGQLTSLKRLSLPICKVTDAGIAQIAGLTRLEDLQIGGKGLTDAGLAHLSRMKFLWRLRISGRFTDAALAHLEKLPALALVTLVGDTKLSPVAMTQFRSARPDVYVRREKEE